MVRFIVTFLLLIQGSVCLADCYQIADESFPKGDWGLYSREGILRGYMCDNAEIRALESNLTSLRAASQQQLACAKRVVETMNHASLLVDLQTVSLKKWAGLYSKCDTSDAAMRECVANRYRFRKAIEQMERDSLKMYGKFNSSNMVNGFACFGWKEAKDTIWEHTKLLINLHRELVDNAKAGK